MFHNCTGTVGVFTSYCPKPVPTCNHLNITATPANSDGSNVRYNKISACVVSNYTEYYTTQLSGVFNDPVTAVDTIFGSEEAQGSAANVGSVNTFARYQVSDSFVAQPEQQSDDPQTVFAIVVLYTYTTKHGITQKKQTYYQSFAAAVFKPNNKMNKKNAKNNKGKTAAQIQEENKRHNKTQAKRSKSLTAAMMKQIMKATRRPAQKKRRNPLLSTAQKIQSELTAYVYSLLPAVFYNTQQIGLLTNAKRLTFFQIVCIEIYTKHRYLSALCSTDKTCENTHNHSVTLVRLLSTQCFIICICSIFFTLQAGIDDHHCDNHLTESDCLHARTPLYSDLTYCQWDHDPTAPFPATALSVCTYKTPYFNTHIMLIILVICCGLTTLFSFLLDHWLRVVFHSTVVSLDLIAANRETVFVNSGRVTLYARLSSEYRKFMRRFSDDDDEDDDESETSSNAADPPVEDIVVSYKSNRDQWENGSDDEEDDNQSRKTITTTTAVNNLTKKAVKFTPPEVPIVK
eukprot:gene40484-50070_t